MAGRNVNGEGTIVQRKDGRWHGAAYVLTPDGTYKRRFVYGKTWDEVHDKLTRLKADSQSGIPVVTSKLSLGEYLTYWLANVARIKVRPATYAAYDSLVRNYLAPGLGKKKLARLTARDIRAFLATTARTCQCCAQGKDKARTERKRRCCALGKCCESYPSDRTVRFLLVLLRAALAHAVREDELPRNVAKNVELSMGTKREIEPLTVEEGRRLLAAARGNRMWAAYELAVRIGMRRGEVLGLRWKDVDLTDGTVTIRQTLQRVGGELLVAAPKTQRSARRVALPGECVTALRARRAQQHGDRLAAGDKWKDDGRDLVFTTKNGTPIEPRNLNRAFTLLCDKAGVRRVRFHDLRHTCASLLHEKGADARMIMEVLGHSSIRVTMDIYTFVRLDSQRSAFDRVGDALRDISGGDDDDGRSDVPVSA
ncbi:integrase [Streptomyces violaceusniger]|uniref:Site-specific integrase n=2 Tax=Streptomyces violaceusniger group TaxID=2839105 RepID=A0ABD5JMR5_9ACTN|nr:site-specific integrase [Streptomyces violaceusniger]KUL47682.1 integrase [Streptomyces violaceusniger]MEE4589007.1 site-specific integrase [Streptomyces sp. DSM 41602]